MVEELHPGDPVREESQDFDLTEATRLLAKFDTVLGPGGTEEQRQDLGDALFALLTPGAVGQLWTEALQVGGPAQPAMRMRIEIAVEDLRRLPWELSRDRNRWLFNHSKLLATRQHAGTGDEWQQDEDDSPDRFQKARPLGPLRVLLVICDPADHKALANSETARVGAALGMKPGRWHVQVLDGPTRGDLFKEVRTWQPHILHFIGHGMPAVKGIPAGMPFNWSTGHSSGERRWWLTSEDIMELLDKWQPRLVVLNACQTATDRTDRLGGLAHAFLEAEAEAVVSMQADIDSPACVRFAAELYKEMASGHAVDTAVYAGRRELREEHTNKNYWALPALVTRGDPESVLAIRQVPSDSSIARLCDHRPYLDQILFVDRAEKRRTAWKVLCPSKYADRPLLVVSGTGKTWFTVSCLLNCFVHGHRVTYVDLARRVPDYDGGPLGPENKDWLSMLRAVRAGCLDESQPEPFPENAFNGFNAALNAELVGTTTVATDEATAPELVTDQGQSFNEDAGHSDERKKRIFRAFLDDLYAASPDRVHVLALDQAQFLQSEPCKQTVYPELIKRIARHEEAPLRMVLVASEGWIRSTLPEDTSGLWEPIVELGGFEQREFMRLAEEYCERAGLNFAQEKEVFEGYCKRLGKHGAPVDLLCSIRRTLVRL
ncbi:CHAT domain-containing protein [Streptomyces doebereineriae]|uniref:CHAT domain-containing protein n=1 Tax=Streptomyces doebereineriae TaxID=3075528 RepID=A0ABU2V2W6_9ACTN|nr:CHAT domain-containing protein [Streptomyces sp. DSM 41640]MDT0479744.1 CHAT domain-containing protein [Streptomyces sp. DSM 41640]